MQFLKRIAEKIAHHWPRERYWFYPGYGDKVMVFASRIGLAEYVAKDPDLFKRLVYGRATVKCHMESDAQWRKST